MEQRKREIADKGKRTRDFTVEHHDFLHARRLLGSPPLGCSTLHRFFIIIDFHGGSGALAAAALKRQENGADGGMSNLFGLKIEVDKGGDGGRGGGEGAEGTAGLARAAAAWIEERAHAARPLQRRRARLRRQKWCRRRRRQRLSGRGADAAPRILGRRVDEGAVSAGPRRRH